MNDDGIAPGVAVLVDPDGDVPGRDIHEIRHAVAIHIAHPQALGVEADPGEEGGVLEPRAVAHGDAAAPAAVAPIGPIFHTPVVDEEDVLKVSVGIYVSAHFYRFMCVCIEARYRNGICQTSYSQSTPLRTFARDRGLALARADPCARGVFPADRRPARDVLGQGTEETARAAQGAGGHGRNRRGYQLARSKPCFAPRGKARRSLAMAPSSSMTRNANAACNIVPMYRANGPGIIRLNSSASVARASSSASLLHR